MKSMPDAVVDVSIETSEGGTFQFANIRRDALLAAVQKALLDHVTLSLVSTDSAALVVPWALVRRVSYVSVLQEGENESDWIVIWEAEGRTQSMGNVA